MKKGISIWSFAAQPLVKSFEVAHDAGFEGVEVGLEELGEIALNSSEAQLLNVKRQANDCGIELYSVASGLYWDYWLNADSKDEREKAKDIVKRHLDAANVLGCDTILIIPGTINSSFAHPERIIDYKTTYERSFEALFELKDYAKTTGVSIGLENVWNKFLTSPMEMRSFIDRLDSDFIGAYLDIGNTLLCGYPEHWVRILAEKIKKVHFKDYRCAAGGLHGFVDLLAGDVNYPEVMRALNEVGYDGWVTAEMIPAYAHHSEAIIYNTSYSMDKILGRR